MRQTDARAIMDSGLDGVELAVALALWSFADDSGRCWPALRSLCRRSGWRERAVQRALRSLEAAKVLSVHHVPARVTPTYVLHVASLPASAETAGDDVTDNVPDGGCTTDTPGACETPPVSVVHPPVSNRHPPVSVVHPPVSVVHPNPSWNPPENPPPNPPDKSTSDSACAEPPAAGAAQLSLLGAEPEPVKSKPPKPTKAAREVEAAAVLFGRLERLRLERYQRLGRTVRGLSPEAWVPKLRKALAKTTAGDIEDGWVWLLRHQDAAWHRGEDRGGSDRCTDFAMLLARPEQYGPRRTWTGLTGLTTIEQEEVAAWLASGGRSADAPAWRERMRAAGVAVPLSTEEDDELWNGIGSAGSSADGPQTRADDGYVCPF